MKVQSVPEIMEQLEKGVENLFAGQYEDWLRTMSRFHSYSWRNTLLIFMQKPDATCVAGYRAWQKNFGRQVQRGEKAIKILAPSSRKIKREVEKLDPETGEPILNPDGSVQTEWKETSAQGFRTVNVFDISSTVGEDLPTLGCTELDGSVHQYEDFCTTLIKCCPVPIVFKEIRGSAKGYYEPKKGRITVRKGMSQRQTVKTLIHEMAHQKLQHAKSSNVSEVEAESVAYVVCSYFGIDTSDYSFGYIAGWSQDKEVKVLKESMARICDTAREMIDTICEFREN